MLLVQPCFVSASVRVLLVYGVGSLQKYSVFCFSCGCVLGIRQIVSLLGFCIQCLVFVAIVGLLCWYSGVCILSFGVFAWWVVVLLVWMLLWLVGERVYGIVVGWGCLFLFVCGLELC